MSNSKVYLKKILHAIPEAKEIDDLDIFHKREIPFNKTYRVFSKQSLKYRDLELNEIDIPIRKVVMPKGYKISNIPHTKERATMQDYHFSFSEGDLYQMIKSPKVVIDKKHMNIMSRGKIVSKTNFFMVAPQVENMGLPVLYRLSAARYLDNPAHHSISMHAIVGGCIDGFLFLGRLDNNTEGNHIIKPEKPILKNGEPIIRIADCDMLEEYYHTIPFPHIHTATARYKLGDIPEKSVPEYVSNCKNNSFKQNIEYMMKKYGISHYTHLYYQDALLADVLKEVKQETILREKRNSRDLIKEIVQSEMQDKEKLTTTDMQGTEKCLLR